MVTGAIRKNPLEILSLLEQASNGYRELLKENEELKKELKEVRRRQKKNILGFSILKRRKSQNSYAYYARKRIDGKLCEVYLGMSLEGAKEKIQERLKVVEAKKKLQEPKSVVKMVSKQDMI